MHSVPLTNRIWGLQTEVIFKFLLVSFFPIPLQRCLQNMVKVTVRSSREEKSYKLEDLLELQNKLMLMSSKGEHGREQVNRFTEVSGF